MSNKNTLGSRIAAFRKKKLLSATDFAKVLDVNVRNIYNYEDNASEPKLVFWKAISKNYPSVNIKWLMFGEGEMFVNESMDKLESLKSRWEDIEGFSDYLKLVRTVVDLDKRLSKLE